MIKVLLFAILLSFRSIMACRDIIVSEDYADFIIEYNTSPEEFKERYQGDCPVPIGISYGTIYRSLSGIQSLERGDYSYEEIPKLYALSDISAVETTGSLRLQNLSGFELKGSGVIIGIIDTGIDAYHEAFRFSNGDTRILSVWDQTNQSGNTPLSQEYGSRYDREQINEELKKESSEILDSLKRNSEHGTFMAGIAAGNINVEKSFASTAPQADLVVVKLKPAKKYLRDYYLINDEAIAFQENDILNAIIFMREIAYIFGRPLIICIPLGTNSGSHSGLSVMGDILNATAGRNGIGVVVSVGNEGNSRHHFSGQLMIDSTGAGYEDVEIRVGPDNKGFVMELWGKSPDIFSIEITSPTGEIIRRVQPEDDRFLEYRLVLERGRVFIRYKLVESRTGDELIQIKFENPTEGIWNIRVFGENLIYGQYNIWLPVSEFVGEDTYFLKPDPNTTITLPSDANGPVSVGAYSSQTGGIYLESGRGYTTDMTIKPTIVAPGVNINGPDFNNTYVRRTGTSVAAAMTAGIMAQIMEWGIVRGNKVNLNTTEIKNYLIRGADRRQNLNYPNREWGYGTVNVYNSIDIIRR